MASDIDTMTLEPMTIVDQQARAEVAIAQKAARIPWIGVPLEASFHKQADDLYSQNCPNGVIYYYERTENGRLVSVCVGLDPRIDDKYRQLGGWWGGRLGFPTTTSRPTPDNQAVFSHFDGGRIYAVTGAPEACWVHGDIRARWSELGEGVLLGYPTTDELTTPDGIGRFNHFQHGSIYWTPDTGAWEVRGAIRDQWAALGWEGSYLGYPVSGETATDQGGVVTGFQRGEIRWKEGLGALDVPHTVRLDSVLVTPSGTSVGGNATWIMNSRGDWSWSGHLHNSGFFDLKVAAAVRLNFVDPNGTGYAAPPASGEVEGTGLGGNEAHRNLFWDDKGNASIIRDFWDKGVAANGVTTRVDVGANPGDIIGAIFVGVVVIVASIFLSSGGNNKVQACPGHRQWDGVESPGSITIYKEGDTPPRCPDQF